MPRRALFFKRRNRFLQARSLATIAFFIAGVAVLAFAFTQKRQRAAALKEKGAARGIASFSALDREFAEKHLLQGEEEPDPDEEIAPAYRDTVQVPRYDYTNQAEAFLENKAEEDRNRALVEHIAEEEARKVKEALAQRIIERNRKRGYEIVLDENFNVISAKAIPKKKPEGEGVKAASASRSQDADQAAAADQQAGEEGPFQDSVAEGAEEEGDAHYASPSD